MNSQNFIPVNRPKIYDESIKYVTEAVKSGWISSEGPFVERFEKAFASYLGVRFATSTNSGTTALHLALMCLNVGKNDEVILPSLTIASCYFAIWYVGAKAIPVDIDPETYNINPDLIESKISENTKAIMVVHLFGHPCDMDPIMKIANKYDLKIIEDAAEAHGAEYKGQKVGTFGDISIYSFYANKIVSTGEGGMLVTNHKKYFNTAVGLKSLNHSKIRFVHNGVGYNYLMSNIEAAMGLGSLENIKKSLEYKRRLANYYNKRLKNIPGVILPVEKPWAKSVYWMYAVQIVPKMFGLDKNKIMENLKNKYNIQTRTFFYPPNVAFKRMGLFKKEIYSVSKRVSRGGFYLPSGLGNTFLEFNKISNLLKYFSFNKT